MTITPTSAAWPVPVVHINGTDRVSLFCGYDMAFRAIRKARDAVSEITIHGRDYMDPNAFTDAYTAKECMMRDLDAFAASLKVIAREIKSVMIIDPHKGPNV